MNNDFVALDLAGAGMRAQRLRMQAIAENLANQHTVGPDGPYQRKVVVMESQSLSEFDAQYQQVLGNEAGTIRTVKTTTERDGDSEPIRVFDPSHPMADDQGFVLMPNISVIREMTDMMEATRSYEANMAAAKTTNDMLNTAMEMLR